LGNSGHGRRMREMTFLTHHVISGGSFAVVHNIAL
jgi:hypothetical protein